MLQASFFINSLRQAKTNYTEYNLRNHELREIQTTKIDQNLNAK